MARVEEDLDLDSAESDDPALLTTEETMAVGEMTLACRDSATLVIGELLSRQWNITTVESCTGGGIMNALTNVEGASEVTEGGVVTYSSSTKTMLGVPGEVIDEHTVYSKETAVAMALAGLRYSGGWADISVGVTGSLSREDPENEGSVAGEVYYAIVNPEAGMEPVAEKFEVPAEYTERTTGKLYVVQYILDAVYDHLQQQK